MSDLQNVSQLKLSDADRALVAEQLTAKGAPNMLERLFVALSGHAVKPVTKNQVSPVALKVGDVILPLVVDSATSPDPKVTLPKFVSLVPFPSQAIQVSGTPVSITSPEKCTTITPQQFSDLINGGVPPISGKSYERCDYSIHFKGGGTGEIMLVTSSYGNRVSVVANGSAASLKSLSVPAPLPLTRQK